MFIFMHVILVSCWRWFIQAMNISRFYTLVWSIPVCPVYSGVCLNEWRISFNCRAISIETIKKMEGICLGYACISSPIDHQTIHQSNEIYLKNEKKKNE